MLKRSTRLSSSGFSLVELLVGLTVTLAVTGAALTLALSSRKLYDADRSRTHLNQSLRGGGDYLTTDLRQAGERLGDDIFAIEVVNGTAGAPDQLVVRRNLIDTVLKVCVDVSGSEVRIPVALKPTHASYPVDDCDPLPDTDLDGWPDNIQQFREFRQADPTRVVKAYIYNPITKLGEFFDYINERERSNLFLLRAFKPGGWANVYTEAANSRVYLLEERRYRLSNDTLQILVNGATASPYNVADAITDFQVRVMFRDGSSQNALSFAAGDDWPTVWGDLRGIEVSMTAALELRRGEMIERTVTTEAMPRNILSR